MYIARILYPVKVLGPGERIAIWFSGCNHFCKGCSNPELWEQQDTQQITLRGIKKLLQNIYDNYPVDGVTLTGGDPFFQPDALRELLPYLASFGKDILVYTGFNYEELKVHYEDLLSYVDVLIDGRYVEEENRGAVLIGSDNQRILYLDASVREKYEEYLKQEKSRIQNFDSSDGIISVGIHLPDYAERLQELTQSKGLRSDRLGLLGEED